MDLINSIVLGVIQGATEFIPVSSSGHLIIVRDILGIQIKDGLAIDGVFQLATTLAILVYFWKDIIGLLASVFSFGRIRKENKSQITLVYAIIFGTVPAIALGLFMEGLMDTLFRNSQLASGSLIVGGIIMWFAEKKYLSSPLYAGISKENNETPAQGGGDSLSARKGFLIGFFQALALIPGFSRSGMTISGGLFLGLNREEATRFSFLLAFPILLGSGLKKLLDLGSAGLLNSLGFSLFAGSLAAFIVGLLAIHFLIKFLKTHTLRPFVIYRFILAVLVLIFI
jgi:undecaprenyl-diphosphatase